VILTAINSAKGYPDALRRISYYDAETEKRLKSLTNNCALPALTIAQIYKWRCQVELFTKGVVVCVQRGVCYSEPRIGWVGGRRWIMPRWKRL
jgi:hypothetical protein